MVAVPTNGYFSQNHNAPVVREMWWPGHHRHRSGFSFNAQKEAAVQCEHLFTSREQQPIHDPDRKAKPRKATATSPPEQVSGEVVERIRTLLAAAGITLHGASVESARIYEIGSPYRIPHTLYNSLTASPVFRPSVHQVAALSRISGYRFEDWLLALDFDLHRLAAAASLLPAKRTRIIDTSFEIFGYVLPDLARWENSPNAVVPFSALLKQRALQVQIQSGCARRSLFARLGTEDAFAYPELLPGSIVRVNAETFRNHEAAPTQPRRLLLIQHEQGYWCGRFDISAAGHVRVAASEMAYAQALLATPAEARVVGAVDMEFRWPLRHEAPVVPQALAGFRQPQPFAAHRSLGALLRQARLNAGLTLTEASRLSRRIASFLHDKQYAIAQSTLADLEAANNPPRHLQKILMLCVAYGVRISDFLAAADVPLVNLGKNVAPAPLIAKWCCSRLPHALEGSSAVTTNGQRNGEIPWFLESCLAELSGIARPSLRDFFWLAGDHPFLPKYMAGSRVALVNRRMKKPVRKRDVPGWHQPAYVLWHRDGRYVCACCSSEENALVLYPESGTGAPERINRGDVEVIGQIVGLARYIV